MNKVLRFMMACDRCKTPFSFELLSKKKFNGSFIDARKAYIRAREEYVRDTNVEAWARLYASACGLQSILDQNTTELIAILSAESEAFREAKRRELDRLSTELSSQTIQEFFDARETQNPRFTGQWNTF